jgi:hypothetical protein
MASVKDRRRLLTGTASGGSIIGLFLLPKCPLCFAMWLGTIGISGLSGGQVQSALAGLLVILAATFGWRFRRADRSSENI